MAKKAGQRVKGGSDAAKSMWEAIDAARWGDLANNPARGLVQVVWSSRLPRPKLPPKLEAECRKSEREWEEKLGAMVVQAVKAEDEDTLLAILAALRHFKQFGNKVVDPARVVAYSFYVSNEFLAEGKADGAVLEIVETRDGKETSRIPLDLKTTPKAVREHLRKHGIESGDRTIYRMFKTERGITLEKAKGGRPKL